MNHTAWRNGPLQTAHERLKRFRADYPDIEIICYGFWQAVIREANTETIITRWDLDELLDKLEELLAVGASD